MGDDVTDWTELREFRAVELTSSYVLSWRIDGDDLTVELDLCLGPDHPFFEPPRPSERACLRPAVLEFPQCESLQGPGGEGSGEAPGAVAAGLGNGRLLGLKRIGDGVYRLDGRFGRVVVHAGRPLLRLRTLAP